MGEGYVRRNVAVNSEGGRRPEVGGRNKAEIPENGVEQEETELTEAGTAKRIPKGFRPKALGCELASYPGAGPPENLSQPQRGCAPISQEGKPRRNGRNPFGVEHLAHVHPG